MQNVPQCDELFVLFSVVSSFHHLYMYDNITALPLFLNKWMCGFMPDFFSSAFHVHFYLDINMISMYIIICKPARHFRQFIIT